MTYSQSTKDTKAFGPDVIAPIMLKIIVPIATRSVADIFNNMIMKKQVTPNV